MATLNEAIVAQKGPFAVELRAGRTYVWCACGLVPAVFKAERDGTAYLCGCRTSQGRPFCDGSHARL